jgi:hypothetical protein
MTPLKNGKIKTRKNPGGKYFREKLRSFVESGLVSSGMGCSKRGAVNIFKMR